LRLQRARRALIALVRAESMAYGDVRRLVADLDQQDTSKAGQDRNRQKSS
jgi:hypothetical protein